MNSISPVRMNSIVKEVSSKKEAIKETAQKVTEEIKSETSNISNDLLKEKLRGVLRAKVSPSELMRDGYSFNGHNVLQKFDYKNDIYKGVQFDKKGVTVEAFMIEGMGHQDKRHVVAVKSNGSWDLMSNGEYTLLSGKTSEKAAQKATELRFDGYKVSGQDEKSISFCKDDVSVSISKESGKEIK